MPRDTIATPGRNSGLRPATGPGPAAGTADLTAALRRARLEAGLPPYRRLARHTHVSTTTVWRIFNGQTFPHWEDLAGILHALRVSSGQIDNMWGEIWFQAQAQRQAPAGPGARGTQAEEREVPRSDSPHARQDQAGARECEDCGAVIGNLVQHQAWHWRIERQFARAPLRAVKGTGQ